MDTENPAEVETTPKTQEEVEAEQSDSFARAIEQLRFIKNSLEAAKAPEPEVVPYDELGAEGG
jgi:hypothetical protein